MKRLIAALAIMSLATFCQTANAQDTLDNTTVLIDSLSTSLDADSMQADADTLELDDPAAMLDMGDMIGPMGMHQQLKQKFIDGGPAFMSLVALVLVIGLALSIERIIYLTRSTIDNQRLLDGIDTKMEASDVESAKTLCRQTPGPVASVCYQGLMHIDEDVDTIERNLINYGSLLSARLEKGCSWISFCITVAPSLGFLGTVIGMVMAFDQIQQAGDIGPTIVAEGMKVALITTIFGIIVALVLQLFYSYIMAKVESLTSQMEEAAITLLDLIMKHKKAHA